MTVDDTALPVSLGSDRTWRFDLVLPLFFRPRPTMAAVAAGRSGLWRAPILLLSPAVVARALLAGYVKGMANSGGELALPPGFEYYTPEQMAQFQQAATATSNPTFAYILPAVGALLGLLLVWLLTGWLLHLALTLLGGRGASGATLDVAAWAALPLLLRAAVQILYMLITRTAVAAPGLSGFAPAATGGFLPALGRAMLAHVDIYFLWQLLLLVLGARLVSQLAPAKTWIAVLLVALLVLALRGLPTAVLAQFSDISVIQPFF